MDHVAGLVGEDEVIEKSAMPYIDCPAWKFPAKHPVCKSIMQNHDNFLYTKGYDSDGNMPYYDKVAVAWEDTYS